MLQAASTDHVKEVLEEWDIERTENLMIKHEEIKETRRKEDRVRREYEIEL